MICPNCGASLLRRQRSRRRCSRCRREFALEPKENPFQLHDLRLRRLAEGLSDAGALRYTETQLWYAAGRKALQARTSALTPGRVVAVLVAGGVSMAIVSAVAGPAWAIIDAALVVAVIAVWVSRRRRARMPMPLARFHTMILGRWTRRYGSPPLGLIDGPVVPQPAPRATAALLCTDDSTARCLYANGVPERYGVWLTSSVQGLPPAVPVLVLHDASIPGCLLVAEARRAAGSRVVDLGVRPRSVMTASGAIRLREAPRDLPADEELRLFTGLAEQEVSWLEKGWWSPLAAVGPARLMSLVAAAVDRIDAGRDPDRRAARAVGFLTWPKP
jgi:hypothetical protein